MFDFEEFIAGLVDKTDFNPIHPFYSQKCFEDASTYIRRKWMNLEIKLEDEHDLIIEQMLKRIEYIESEYEKGNLVYADDLDYYTRCAKKKVNILRRKERVSVEEMLKISEYLFNIVEQLRTPWRRDIKTKIEILSILAKYPENEITDRFYYNMLLNGLQFDYSNMSALG